MAIEINVEDFICLSAVRPEVRTMYGIGNFDLLSDRLRRIAVVGSRKMTEYGKEVMGSLVSELARKGGAIVSGFMYGIDQVAHRKCIDSGGKTIAVLGWGIDRQVAGEDMKLFQMILDSGGLMLSEYGGQMMGLPGPFLPETGSWLEFLKLCW